MNRQPNRRIFINRSLYYYYEKRNQQAKTGRQQTPAADLAALPPQDLLRLAAELHELVNKSQ